MASGPRTDQTGQIVPRSAAPSNDLATLVTRLAPEMARALPAHVRPERMARIALTALRVTPKLTECTPASFLGCLMQAAQLGLEVNTPLGQAYLIPRWSSKRRTTECTLIVGYQGMLDIARRSGRVGNVYAYAVREGDRFEYELGTRRRITHVPSEAADRETRLITHVYAVATYGRDGSAPDFEVLTRAQVDARHARSAARDSGPWVTDYEAMATKTAIRALYRWLPKSVELARAEAIDTAADRGAPALSATDPQIIGLLQAQGVATAEDAEPEIVEAEARQPGEEEEVAP